MGLVITGSAGNIGRRLMRAFPGAVGIDRTAGVDIVTDLATVDYGSAPLAGALRYADALIHLATSADPDASEDVHWQAVANAARLLRAAAAAGVRRVVVASSDWAEPKGEGLRPNAYGHSKRVLEAMAAMYGISGDRFGVALRVGWVPGSEAELAGTPGWLVANHWNEERLVAEFRAALGL